MSNGKDRRPGWWERAGRRLDEFSQWVNRRCGVLFRCFVKWLVRVVETAVETVVAVAKTTVETVAQNQTVKTIAAGAKGVADVADRALHVREWCKWMGLMLPGLVR